MTSHRGSKLGYSSGGTFVPVLCGYPEHDADGRLLWAADAVWRRGANRLLLTELKAVSKEKKRNSNVIVRSDRMLDRISYVSAAVRHL